METKAILVQPHITAPTTLQHPIPRPQYPQPQLSSTSSRSDPRRITRALEPATMLIQTVHILQSLLSLYGLSISYFSITNLQKYEEQTKKAAKWSTTAEHQLHKTRTTQASGALTVRVLPFLSSALTPPTQSQFQLPCFLPYLLSSFTNADAKDHG